MPIKPHKIENFDDAVFDEIAKREQFRSHVYLDSVGIPTIGYGHAFYTKDGDINKQAFEDINASGIGLSQKDLSVFEKIESILQTCPRDITELKGMIGHLTLKVDKSEAKTLFTHAVGHKIDDLERKIGSELYEELDSSKELLSLLDLTYNGGAGIIYPSLLKALSEGNREEVWYKIRYTTNGGRSRSKGIANRRVSESNIFGLTNENPTELDIQHIEAMMRQHSVNIERQENAFPITRRSPSANPYVGDNAMKEQLEKAKIDLSKAEEYRDAQGMHTNNTGRIFFDATLLSGVKHKVSEGVYEDAMFSYTESEGNLIIAQKEDPTKSITVENWNANTKEVLGIELLETAVNEIENINEGQNTVLPENVDTYLEQFGGTNNENNNHINID